MLNFLRYVVEMRFTGLSLGLAVAASLVGCSPSATNIDSFSNDLPFDSPASFDSFLAEEGHSCRLLSTNNDGIDWVAEDYWGEGRVINCFDPSDEVYWVFIAAEPDWKYRLCVSRYGHQEFMEMQANGELAGDPLANSMTGFFSGWGDATIVGESFFLSVFNSDESFYTIDDWQKILDGEVYESHRDFCDEYRALWEQQ